MIHRCGGDICVMMFLYGEIVCVLVCVCVCAEMSPLWCSYDVAVLMCVVTVSVGSIVMWGNPRIRVCNIDPRHPTPRSGE